MARPSPRRRAAGLAVTASLLLSAGLTAACTGQEHREVLEVGDKTKKKVDRINEQLEKRAETIVEGD